ncbi:radical SAM protein [Methanothrix soehngenii]|uniref:radical SAM protein n=1 Tax=Methanothrix soehngenii TaxID=2223 RepID=UPI00300CB9AA
MCRYCSFSDFYEYNRGYSDKYMDFDTAKKAIDYFISLLNEGKKYNPIRKPALGFYGGEPLLNFGLIKKCIEYIESIYNDYEIIYTITTNGSMLDKKRANWLMEHDFIIFVSLDGPEDEHDRLRIYENGKGSFRDVIKNVTRIIRKGYKEIYCMPVFDWKSDLFKREDSSIEMTSLL